MLNAKHRFHGYGSLKAAYSRGQTARDSLVTLRFLKRDSSKAYRVAVVVSRKVSKSSLKRNRIRRRLYEAVRLQAELIQPGTDLIFTVFHEKVAEMESAELQKIIKKLLNKASGG